MKFDFKRFWYFCRWPHKRTNVKKILNCCYRCPHLRTRERRMS